MKNYTFTKDLNLGIISVSVKRGDIVTEKNGVFIYNNTKYDNVRDFQIALQKGWLVDSESFTQSEKVAQNFKNDFGFKVQKQQQSVVSIPITKFQQNVLNQSDGFIEDGNQLKSLESTGIHVATKDVEQPQKPLQATQSAVNAKSEKNIEKKKTATKSQAKQEKKEIAKKSRIMKDGNVGQQQVIGEVMGMKIIKGE